MKIRVEQHNIDCGIPRSPEDCAIAQAIRGSVPCLGIHILHSGQMCIDNVDHTLWFRVKEPMRDKVDSFIRSFDRGLVVGPIEFELDLFTAFSPSQVGKHSAMYSNQDSTPLPQPPPPKPGPRPEEELEEVCV